MLPHLTSFKGLTRFKENFLLLDALKPLNVPEIFLDEWASLSKCLQSIKPVIFFPSEPKTDTITRPVYLFLHCHVIKWSQPTEQGYMASKMTKAKHRELPRNHSISSIYHYQILLSDETDDMHLIKFRYRNTRKFFNLVKILAPRHELFWKDVTLYYP